VTPWLDIYEGAILVKSIEGQTRDRRTFGIGRIAGSMKARSGHGVTGDGRAAPATGSQPLRILVGADGGRGVA
jgi:hypothetical protein